MYQFFNNKQGILFGLIFISASQKYNITLT